MANHPLGGLDGVAMINEIGKYRKDIKFLVNDILTHLEPFKEYFIPINKHGLNSRENILRIDKLFQSNQCIEIFQIFFFFRKKNKKKKKKKKKKEKRMNFLELQNMELSKMMMIGEIKHTIYHLQRPLYWKCSLLYMAYLEYS